jgi:branched-chain amino acid aminotransferase/4-amino-4-deoxychorismate lyase
MRAQVLAAAPALGLEPVEIRAGVQALDGAAAIFITNSLIGVREAAVLDGRPLPQDGRVKALAKALEPVS